MLFPFRVEGMFYVCFHPCPYVCTEDASIHLHITLKTMELDIDELKRAGADGLVFGVLVPGGEVDIAATSRLVHLARP